MKNIKANLITSYYKCEGVMRKHSPEILATVGVIGVVSSTIMACKSTMKLNTILDETKNTVEKIKEVSVDPSYAEKYSEEDAKKDLSITYIQTGVKIAKLYAPSIVLGVVSLGCLLSSNNILRKRNAALSAAYMTVNKSFKDYTERVKERFGEKIEKEIRYNIKAQDVETVVTDEEGNTSVVYGAENVMDPNLYSDYARFFDETCANWQSIPEYNLMFLKTQQQYANDLLKTRGRLFLNEVYELLGMEPTKAGQVVGWVYDYTTHPTMGDNFVDFGIYDMDKERVRAFVNGHEPSILLDFNVDGNIWDLM